MLKKQCENNNFDSRLVILYMVGLKPSMIKDTKTSREVVWFGTSHTEPY